MRLTSKIFYLGLVFALLLGTLVTIQQIDDYNYSIEIEKIEIDDNSARLKLLKAKYDNLNQALDKAGTDKVQLEQRLQELQREKESLQSELLAKQEQKNRMTLTGTAYASSGTHNDWMLEAGIPQEQWVAAERLVQRESSWNPLAQNSIGACSLVQAYPCSKIPGDWRDPVTALKWGHQYVVSRYGTWDNALSHSYANNWY